MLFIIHFGVWTILVHLSMTNRKQVSKFISGFHFLEGIYYLCLVKNLLVKHCLQKDHVKSLENDTAQIIPQENRNCI